MAFSYTCDFRGPKICFAGSPFDYAGGRLNRRKFKCGYPVFVCMRNFDQEPKTEENKRAMTTLYALESTIRQRKEEKTSPNGNPSWEKRLLQDDNIREEADELCRTLEENEDKARTGSEMADILYHTMELLAKRGVEVKDVMQVLRHRFQQSGIEEKESRHNPQAQGTNLVA